MKKVLGTILFVVYAIIAITVTVLLLSYNEYNNSQLGGYTVYIVKEDSLEPKYKQGSILLIKSTTDKNVQIGDDLLLYKVLSSQEYEVVNKTLTEKLQQGRHVVYKIGEDESYASDYFIGKTSDTIVINGWGYVLGLLESRWGYLFCVVIVSLLLFLQEVFELVMEIKYGGGKKKKKNAVEVKSVKEDETEEDEEDEDELEEVKVVKKAPAKKAPAKKTTTTSKSTTRTTSKSGNKTGTAKKSTGAKSTTTAKKASTTSKSDSKTTAKKRTSKPKTASTKSAKEEE